MLRFAHRILSERGTRLCLLPVDRNRPESREEMSKMFIRELRDSPVFIADEAATHVSENGLDKCMAEMPSVMPPYKKMFIEFMRPAANGQNEPIGWLITLDEMDSYDFDRIHSSVNSNISTLSEVTQSRAEDAVKVMHLHLFSEVLHGPAVWTGAMVGLYLDAEGRIVLVEFISTFANEIPGLTSEHILRLLGPALLTLSLLNCKNVTYVDATQKAGPSEKWMRRQRVPKLKYHVLKIGLDDTRYRSEAVEHSGIGKSLHVCRGHFKHWNNGVGPFGRKINEPLTLWCPDHAKGNIKNGVVAKDYSVNLASTVSKT